MRNSSQRFAIGLTAAAWMAAFSGVFISCSRSEYELIKPAPDFPDKNLNPPPRPTPTTSPITPPVTSPIC